MKGNLAKDSIILSIVRIVTMGTNIIQTMILARIMSLMEYGVYSQLLIVISIVTTFTNLGLNNAVNYFYNKYEKDDQKKKYINVIFALTIITGLIGAGVIFCFRKLIANYYENPIISVLIIYILLRPLFANIISLYQSLYISVGKAKVIAVRNFLVSVVQTILVPVVFYIFKNITAMLIVQLSLDIVQVLYFGINFSKRNLLINPFLFDKKVVKEILKFAIPMGLALMMATLFKESDKLVIAKLADVEKLAIYTNMSKQLPFEFIALSFTAVITPVIVKYYYSNKYDLLIKLWSNYISFGYISTWIMTLGAIICSKELLVLLYSEKYLSGLNIFIIYLFIEMYRFTYFGMILSATGNTKSIMMSSMSALFVNIILNILFYKLFGFIGPAFASLLCVIVMNSTQFILSCKILKKKVTDIILLKDIKILVFKLTISGILVYTIKCLLYRFINNYLIVLFVTYFLYLSINAMLNKNQIKNSLMNMKGEKNEN